MLVNPSPKVSVNVRLAAGAQLSCRRAPLVGSLTGARLFIKSMSYLLYDQHVRLIPRTYKANSLAFADGVR